MKNEKEKKLKTILVENQTDYMQSLHQNVDALMDEFDLTIKELAEKADIPFDTLKTFLYGYTKDCKLSTAIKLARVFGISVDELVGAGTINSLSRESLAICRNLPPHSVYLIRQFIHHQDTIYKDADGKSKIISALIPECRNGFMHTTNIVESVCVDHLAPPVKSKVALGLKIPCDHYMPYYAPDDTILIAADRDGLDGEKCLISYNGYYYIVIKRFYIDNGVRKYKYVSLINQKTEILSSEIDEKLGYIIGFLNPDESWGIR